MSLGIVFKGPEGIVLAADSRVTINAQVQTPQGMALAPAYYDNATKLLQVESQKFVGAVTYGLGALGAAVRTAHSYMNEFEKHLLQAGPGPRRRSVEDFARELGQFFDQQYRAAGTPPDAGEMYFLVGGYDENQVTGRVFLVSVPGQLVPQEQNANDFGLSWGGQSEIVARILNSHDAEWLDVLSQQLNVHPAVAQQAATAATMQCGLKIPYQFLPLQDCVDLSILLVRTTAQLMNYTIGIRGVGGAVDVATITPVEGIANVQHKSIKGERVSA
jgi:hypothetical protein